MLSAGEAFGEMAFLLKRPRSFDVDAATDGTRILGLSERAIRTMIAEDSDDGGQAPAQPVEDAVREADPDKLGR